MNYLLWKFYKTESSHIHYLFGTMHIGRYDALLLAKSVTQYLDLCALYAGETDMDALASPDIIQHFKLQPDSLLSAFYKPTQFNKFRRSSIKYFDLDLNHFENYTPFFVMNLITQKLLADENAESVDRFLWLYAQEKGKKLAGVESIDEQIDYFNRIPMDYQVKAFKKTMLNITAFRRGIRKLNNTYLNQDLNALYIKTRRSLGSIRQMMINERNHKMTSEINKLADRQACFISIGAAHLAGANGILRLLKKHGFKLEPIAINI